MPSPVKVTVFYDERQPPEVILDIDRGWSESLHSPSQSSGAALFTFFCFTFMSVIATHFWRTRARS